MIRLKQETLDWTLKHIEIHGDNAHFSKPFEYSAIRHQWENGLRDFLMNMDLNQWQTRFCRKLNIPDSEHGNLMAVQLDPLDMIVFTSLVREIAEDIEASRVPAEDGIVHSNRFVSDESSGFCDSSCNRMTFIDETKRKVAALSDKQNAYVVIAKVADLMSWTDIHVLEAVLLTRTTKREHVHNIIHMLANWQMETLSALPEGVQAAEFLAEVLLDLVDRHLIKLDIHFSRFESEYHLVCKDERTAYEALKILTRLLYDKLGLGLQHYKSRVVPGFAIGVEAGDLDGRTPQEIMVLLREQIKMTNIDTDMTLALLKRCEILHCNAALDLCMMNMDKLMPAMKGVFQYLKSLKGISAEEKHAYGEFLLSMLDRTTAGQALYYRFLLCSLFAHSGEWCDVETLQSLYEGSRDEFSRRKLILALRHQKAAGWVKERRVEFRVHTPWEKRALLASTSCLELKEADSWFRGFEGEFDILDRILIEWVRRICIEQERKSRHG